jgi:hypothetical protein
MLRKIILSPILFLLLFATTHVFGQSGYQDVVYLKNGSIIRGMIIEQIPNQSLKIETADRNVFVFQIDEIEKITKEPKVDRKKSTPERKEFLVPGYEGTLNISYSFGVGDLGMDYIRFTFMNGYRVAPAFKVSFETGIHYYFEQQLVYKAAALIPLLLNLQANIPDDKVTPFVGFSIGHTLDANDKFRGVGLYMSPSLGVLIPAGKSNLNVTLSYQSQTMKFYYFSFDPYGYNFGSSIIKRNSNSVGLSFGINF